MSWESLVLTTTSKTASSTNVSLYSKPRLDGAAAEYASYTPSLITVIMRSFDIMFPET